MTLDVPHASPEVPAPSLTQVRALLPRRDLDPRMVARLVRPGRVCDIGRRTWAAAWGQPSHAASRVREGMRGARALHSRERRAVADLLHDLARLSGALLPWVRGAEDPAAAMWWMLSVHHGVPVEEAEEGWREQIGGESPPLDRAVDLVSTLGERWAPGGLSVLAEAAGVDREVAEGLAEVLGEGVWDFLIACAQRAPLSVRVDARRAEVGEVARGLRASGVDVEISPVAPHGLQLPTGTHLAGLPRRWRSVIEPQDDASQLIAELVRPEARRVLDLCAGAGGKTLAVASRAPQASLWATDVRSSALERLKARARRHGVKVQTARWREERVHPDPGWDFDEVVVDAPCSGTGVWRRHPTWRLHLGAHGVPDALQAELLDRGAERVRSGGRLIYATCSVLTRENEAQVVAFSQRHPAFRAIPVAEVAPHLPRSIAAGPFLRTLPHVHGTDGFFAAVFERSD